MSVLVAVSALIGAGLLAGVAVFAFFGGYWYQLLRERTKRR